MNLTSHEIFEVESGLRIPKSGTVVRVDRKKKLKKTIKIGDKTIKVSKTVMGEIHNLPKRKEGTIYVVSEIVKKRIPSRDDFICPDTIVRNAKGRPIGCRGFA